MQAAQPAVPRRIQQVGQRPLCALFFCNLLALDSVRHRIRSDLSTMLSRPCVQAAMRATRVAPSGTSSLQLARRLPSTILRTYHASRCASMNDVVLGHDRAERMQPRRTRIDTTPTDTLSKEYTKPAPQASVDIHGLHETVLVDEVRCKSCHASLCGVLMCSVCVCGQAVMMWRRPGLTSGHFVDGTCGDGGHALALLRDSPEGVKVMCIDRDAKVRAGLSK